MKERIPAFWAAHRWKVLSAAIGAAVLAAGILGTLWLAAG